MLASGQLSTVHIGTCRERQDFSGRAVHLDITAHQPTVRSALKADLSEDLCERNTVLATAYGRDRVR
jgi:hypothetical protein